MNTRALLAAAALATGLAVIAGAQELGPRPQDEPEPGEEVGPLTDGANSDEADAATIPQGSTDMFEDRVDPEDPLPFPEPQVAEEPAAQPGLLGEDAEPTLPPDDAPATEYGSTWDDSEERESAIGADEDAEGTQLLDEPSEGLEVEKGQVNDDPLQ